MKGRGAVVLLAVVGLIVAFFAFGGEAEGPTDTPDVSAPDVNETTSRIRDFYDNVAEVVTGWSDNTWRIIVIFGAAALLWWAFKKIPLVVWLVIAVLAALIAVGMQ